MIRGLIVAVLGAVIGVPALGADDSRAIVEKAIKAMGGEAALGKAKGFSFKARSIVSLQGAEHEGEVRVTVDGLGRFREEFVGDGTHVKLLNGDKGSVNIDGNRRELDKEAVASAKREVYLSVIPITILPLREKDYKLESVPDLKVGERPAVGLKVTPPDGKEFRLYFDKESGLPVKLVIKIVGFMNKEFAEETTFSGYKEMGGIKKATRLDIETTLEGESKVKVEITEFKVLEKVDSKLFDG